MLLEKNYDDMTWEYGSSNKPNLMFKIETKGNGFNYSFEVFFEFPNEFRIEVYYRGEYGQKDVYSYSHEYKRFDYLLEKLKFLIDFHSNGQLVHTVLYKCSYTSLMKYLQFLNLSTEV